MCIARCGRIAVNMMIKMGVLLSWLAGGTKLLVQTRQPRASSESFTWFL
jgi:hypothetical protein